MFRRLRLLIVPLALTSSLLISPTPAYAADCSGKYALVHYANSGSIDVLLEFYMSACWESQYGLAYGTSQYLVDYTNPSGYGVRSDSQWLHRSPTGQTANSWVAFDFNVYLEEYSWNRLHPRVYYGSGTWDSCGDAGGSFLQYRGCSFSSTYVNI